MINMFRCLTIAALVTSLGVAQTVTLQTCTPQVAASTFAISADGSISAAGGCLAFSQSSLTVAPCGSTPPAWKWHADGTVESIEAAGQCWNCNGGATTINTTIIEYSCGSTATVAANDVFAFNAATGQILANESGLCLSTDYIPPPPPPPPGTCNTDFDCTLSGRCTAGTCVCYPPWTAAPDCSALKFAPSPAIRGYPPPSHNETTWGGSIAYDPTTAMYHMYVAEMMNQCPLSTWGRNSRCSHAVSQTPEGPYAFADVAVTNWCHNPAIIVKGGLWALFHIGDGTGGATDNCTKTTLPVAATLGAKDAIVAPNAGSTLHTAPGPSGPWTPAAPLPSCNNPAPFLATNGSVFVVCDGFKLYRGDNLTAAGDTWHLVTTIKAQGTPIAGNYEDPFLYIDARGNWHVIYHVYRTGPVGGDAHNCLPGHDGAVVSGHYFSADGLDWRTSPTMPYGNVVDLDDGSQLLLTTRERPKMLFNAMGEPTHLSNGVCPSPGNFSTPFSCPKVSTGCVDCKYNDWDFTNVSPLQLT